MSKQVRLIEKQKYFKEKIREHKSIIRNCNIQIKIINKQLREDFE